MKISIIGSGGAGKSTLARKLSEKTGIVAYHLDALYWKPGWVETDRESWRALQEELCGRNEWILDGNYGGTLDVRLKHSNIIIFLDINPLVCLVRAVWRSVVFYGKTRPDMAVGCKEQIDFAFAKWILEYRAKKRPEIMRRLGSLPADKRVFVLHSSAEVDVFVQNFPPPDLNPLVCVNQEI